MTDCVQHRRPNERTVKATYCLLDTGQCQRQKSRELHIVMGHRVSFVDISIPYPVISFNIENFSMILGYNNHCSLPPQYYFEKSEDVFLKLRKIVQIYRTKREIRPTLQNMKALSLSVSTKSL